MQETELMQENDQLCWSCSVRECLTASVTHMMHFEAALVYHRDERGREGSCSGNRRGKNSHRLALSF